MMEALTSLKTVQQTLRPHPYSLQASERQVAFPRSLIPQGAIPTPEPRSSKLSTATCARILNSSLQNIVRLGVAVSMISEHIPKKIVTPDHDQEDKTVPQVFNAASTSRTTRTMARPRVPAPPPRLRSGSEGSGPRRPDLRRFPRGRGLSGAGRSGSPAPSLPPTCGASAAPNMGRAEAAGRRHGAGWGQRCGAADGRR